MSLFAFLAIGLAASAARKPANRVITISAAGAELGIQEVT